MPAAFDYDKLSICPAIRIRQMWAAVPSSAWGAGPNRRIYSSTVARASPLGRQIGETKKFSAGYLYRLDAIPVLDKETIPMDRLFAL